MLAQGRAEEAASALQRALTVDLRNGATLENLGLALLMLGRFDAAEQTLQRASRIAGAPGSVFMRLGLAILEQGRAQEALDPLERALTLAPGDPDCHLNLGRARATLGDLDGAADCFENALKLAPARPEPAYNLGVVALQRQDLVHAKHWFEQALARAPAYPDARLNLGIVLREQSALDASVAELRRALALMPASPIASSELARSLMLRGDLEQAHHHFQAALSAAPDFAPALEGLAALQLALGRTPEAIESLQRAVAIEPENVALRAGLGVALFQAGDLNAAAEEAECAVKLRPSHPASYATLANVHLVREELARAIEILETGYTATASSELLGMLTYQLRQACDWIRWPDAWNEMAQRLDGTDALGSPFWLLCEPTSPEQQLAYARRWASSRFRTTGRAGAATRAPARTGDRMRIGYLSSDMHEHATAYLMAEVLERHDRGRFEVFIYSYGPEDDSAMRRRLRGAVAHFIDIARDPDDVAAERIRSDAVDILVDLKGYTLGDRVSIMAHRPCPVQATWLGYPGTTGAPFIDYLIADPVVVPADAEAHYSERIVRLPRCYQPNDRARRVDEPLRREDYGLPAQGFVFCCFNQSYKITPDVFAAWMRLLEKIPGSVLWLLESNPLAKQNLLAAAQRHGVAQERLIFAPRRPNSEHLARYRVADLALDTFPYTSHTTMSDALWCACPAIALCGETFASRVSASVLSAADLEDLVTRSLESYEALALHLARDASALGQVRARVLDAREHSALFDSTQFTRDLETLYERLVVRDENASA